MAFHPLRTYLHDHLAGAQSALRLLKDLRSLHAGDEIGALASELHGEVSADRATLRKIGKRVGVRRSVIKETAGWIAAQLLRPKSETASADGLGTYQKLEVLSLGIEGKKMLWNTLANTARIDRRLTGFDFAGLSERATVQRDKVDRLGRALSTDVFAPRD